MSETKDEKGLFKLPLYNSIIYGSETYHYSTNVEFNYNKQELDIVLIFMKIFYLILMEDKKLSENYLDLVTKMKNNFLKDILLYSPKTCRIYPTEDAEGKRALMKESGYSEVLGAKICSHIKLLIQFLIATSYFYEKNFLGCIQTMSQKILTKDKKQE